MDEGAVYTPTVVTPILPFDVSLKVFAIVYYPKAIAIATASLRAESATLVPLICTSTVLFSVPVTSSVEPSNVRFPLSSRDLSDLTVTTRPAVKSSTFAVVAAIPPSKSAREVNDVIPTNVETPATDNALLIPTSLVRVDLPVTDKISSRLFI